MEKKEVAKRYCLVSTCPNFLGTTDPNIHFFTAPSLDHKLLGKWKEAVNSKRGGFRLCILHFREQDIIRHSHRIKLRSGAVPMIVPAQEPMLVPAQEPEVLITDNNVNNSAVDPLTVSEKMRDIEPVASIKEEPADSEFLCPFCIDYEIQLEAARTKIASLEKRLCEANIKIRRLEIGIQTEDIKYDIWHIKEEPIDQEEDNLDDELIEVIPIDETSSDDSLLPDSLYDTVGQEHISDQASVMKSERTEAFNETINFFMQPSRASYTQHVLNLFQCEICCNSTFASALHLKRHLQREHRSTALSFECFLCGTSFYTAAKLCRHMKVLHARDQTCKSCKMPFTANELSSHLCGDRKSIRCDYCTHEFTTTIALLDHIESTHENKKFYGCDKCPTFYPMLALREIHMKSHALDAPKLFACEKCHKAFPNENRLNIHIKTHDPNRKKHLCEICGKGFTNRRDLSTHMQSLTHNGPSIKCPHCPKAFSQDSGFKRHMAMHQNNKYVCKICQKELISMMSYNKHMKKHQRTEADRKFECKLCPLKFFSSLDLRKHQVVHSPTRAYKCQFCNQTYKYRSDLNKHLKRHLGDKIHECGKCSKRFKYPIELQKHEFQHYKEEKEAAEMANKN